MRNCHSRRRGSRIENVPDATVIEPTDAVVRVTRACLCGTDLWPYRTLEHRDTGRRMGHETIGVVEAVGADVRTMKGRRSRRHAVRVLRRQLRLLP
jgi:threonine dehydrogenase-like Zn-dependent dehydrogenase